MMMMMMMTIIIVFFVIFVVIITVAGTCKNYLLNSDFHHKIIKSKIDLTPEN